MGKVLVSGHAEQDYAPDYAQVNLKVQAEGTTAAKAITSTMTEFEKLVAGLSDLGFKPENMTIETDRSTRPYRSNEDNYNAERSVSFQIPVDLAVVNRIQNLIASGFENTTFSIKYDLSKRTKLMRDLIILAIQDSRKTADLLAEATGSHITGIDSARMDDDDNMDLDIADLDLTVIDIVEPGYAGAGLRLCSTNYSDKLKPENITLAANVNIVWKIE